uniref:KASH domain-containing protein n=1 Tax=Mesocestoides corti TaxID=53468 RepID=A0A5K3F9M8_MESCO
MSDASCTKSSISSVDPYESTSDSPTNSLYRQPPLNEYGSLTANQNSQMRRLFSECGTGINRISQEINNLKIELKKNCNEANHVLTEKSAIQISPMLASSIEWTESLSNNSNKEATASEQSYETSDTESATEYSSLSDQAGLADEYTKAAAPMSRKQQVMRNRENIAAQTLHVQAEIDKWRHLSREFEATPHRRGHLEGIDWKAAKHGHLSDQSNNNNAAGLMDQVETHFAAATDVTGPSDTRGGKTANGEEKGQARCETIREALTCLWKALLEANCAIYTKEGANEAGFLPESGEFLRLLDLWRVEDPAQIRIINILHYNLENVVSGCVEQRKALTHALHELSKKNDQICALKRRLMTTKSDLRRLWTSYILLEQENAKLRGTVSSTKTYPEDLLTPELDLKPESGDVQVVIEPREDYLIVSALFGKTSVTTESL